MRTISFLLAGSVLASCTAVPPAPTRTAEAQHQYETLLAGKVPQAPMTCLPSNRTENMVRVDENTVVFRESGARVYVNHMQGPCSGLTNSATALVTNEHGSGPCSGDIARVVDTSANMPVGACAWGEFVPYVRPGA